MAELGKATVGRWPVPLSQPVLGLRAPAVGEEGEQFRTGSRASCISQPLPSFAPFALPQGLHARGEAGQEIREVEG